MSRTSLLVLGAVCWTVAGVDALLHLVNGDLVVPTAMAAIAIVWIGVRSQMLARRATPVEVPAEV